MKVAEQEETAKREEEVHILEEDAYRYWVTPVEGAHAPRSYLTEKMVQKVFDALDRPVTLEEIRLLVGFDEGTESIPGGINGAICSLDTCGKRFTPMFWVEPSVRLLERIWSVGEINPDVFEGELQFGAFYSNPDNLFESPIALCGSPYFYNKKQGKTLIASSHLGKAKRGHPKHYWGRSASDIEKIRETVRSRKAARRAADQEELISVRSLFKKSGM